jgi:hypothetical protein
MKSEPAIGYSELLEFDDKAYIKDLREREFEKLKSAGKVWRAGDPVDGLSPSLRQFIESHNQPSSTPQFTQSDAQNEHF